MEEDYEAVEDADSEKCVPNESRLPQSSDMPFRKQSGITFDPNSKIS